MYFKVLFFIYIADLGLKRKRLECVMAAKTVMFIGKGCPANTSSCVLIGSHRTCNYQIIIRDVTTQVHLVLFRICMEESCDKLWSHFAHFPQVTHHFVSERAKDTYTRLRVHN